MNPSKLTFLSRLCGKLGHFLPQCGVGASLSQDSKVVIIKTPDQQSRVDEIIHEVVSFKGLQEEQLVEIVNALTETVVNAGEEIIKQGGIRDYFYVVKEGSLDVYLSRIGQPAIKQADYDKQ